MCYIQHIFLVFYLVFHNEPSVKSSSVSLSILMFVGCYLTIGYYVILVLHELCWLDFCMARIWLCGNGVSISLVLATLLVKMLRVYRIFTAFKILQRSVYTSDFALFIYPLLIISPNIVLLIIWTTVNLYSRTFNFIERHGFIEVVLGCYSDYRYIFHPLLLAYLFLLCLLL